MTEDSEFIEYDPLARFGDDRAEARKKLLISGQIETLVEDKGIERSALARASHVAVSEIDAMLEGRPLSIEIERLRLVLGAALSL